MSVSVVVPNFNGADFVGECLAAVAAQTVPVHELIVVDNGSSDGSAERIRREHPTVRVEALDQNLGFAGGANHGVRAASGDWVVVLNSDAVLAPDWIELLLAADVPDRTWALGGILLFPHGAIESAGDAYAAGGYAFKLLKGRSPSVLPAAPYEVFAPPGAAVMFRRDVFLALGGYAEHFFLYYEDVDLAWRARLRGWRASVVPAARVVHGGGLSGRAFRTWFHIGRNSLWCAVRNVPELRARSLLRRTAREAREARARGVAWPYLVGRAAGAVGVRRALRERREIQKHTVVDRDALRAFLGVPPELRGVI